MAFNRAVSGEEGGYAFLALGVVGDQVELVEHQPAAFVGEFLIVLAQFFDDGVGVVNGIGVGVEGGDVDDVQQDVGALQVAQELVAEAGAVGRAFDRLGAAGAACVFEETGELVGCEKIMASRAITPELGAERRSRACGAGRCSPRMRACSESTARFRPPA